MAAFNVDAPVLGTRKAQALCPQPALPCCGHRAASPGWLSMAVKAFEGGFDRGIYVPAGVAVLAAAFVAVLTTGKPSAVLSHPMQGLMWPPLNLLLKVE